MRKALRSMALCCAFALLSAPAPAWGPKTQSSAVAAASQLLSQDGSIPLLRLGPYVIEGSRVSEETQRAMHPGFQVDAVGAIQREMILLQSVRGDRIDPYFAYRLGVLGKLVASATAPMVNANPSVRSEYYGDVDDHIEGADLRSSPRKQVDPRAYFSLVTADAAERNQTLVVDYRGGIGYDGVARAALSIDISRSVNALADVWYTIFTTTAVDYEVSRTQIRDYVLGAMRYYLSKTNNREVEEVYRRGQALGVYTADVRKTVGDLFFESGQYERAIEEYRKVLDAAPGRRDVTEKIANYYEQLADDARENLRLEDARDAYESALGVDSLHPDAQRKLLEVERQIYARDERLIAQRMAVESARDLESRAEDASMRRNYAQAIAYLRDAELKYRTVTGEFPAEAQTRNRGLKSVAIRTRELKQKLIVDAQSLSGSGFAQDARHLAGQMQGGPERALREMREREYTSAIRGLQDELNARLNERP